MWMFMWINWLKFVRLYVYVVVWKWFLNYMKKGVKLKIYMCI